MLPVDKECQQSIRNALSDSPLPTPREPLNKHKVNVRFFGFKLNFAGAYDEDDSGLVVTRGAWFGSTLVDQNAIARQPSLLYTSSL